VDGRDKPGHDEDKAPAAMPALSFWGKFAMVAKKEIDPELLAEAKRLYEQTLAPVDDIAGMLGLSRSNFYTRAREGGWRGRRASTATFHFTRALSGGAVMAMTAEPAEQPRAEPAACDDAVSPQQRLALALRIQSVVEREMDAIERVLGKITPADQIEAEHGARTLASIARTLREIAALNRPEQETPSNEADDDGGPFAKAAVDAYRAKLTAENTSEKIAADLAARELLVEQRERELAAQVVIAEQGRWYTALPRPLFALAFIIYVWKVVVFDKVLGWGTTDPLSGDVAQWAMIVLTAYFGGRSLEKVARILARK